MKQIFLAPRSSPQSAENFRKTIEKGYKKVDLESYLSQEEKDALKDKEYLYLWGNTPGGKSGWNKLNLGDYIFFYQQKKITWIGEVLYKTHNKELADFLWDQIEKDGKLISYEYIFFLDNLRKVDIDYNILKNYAQYNPKHVVQGFQPYKKDGINKILEEYSSIENFIAKFEVSGNSDVTKKEQIRNFWWVNQGKTYQSERDGGFIWAPQNNERGQELFHWTNVSKVKNGDIIFNYANGAIRAVSKAFSNAYQSTKPESIANRDWENTGWKVDLAYYDLSEPIVLNQVAQSIYELNLSKGPINKNIEVNQGYLFAINYEAAQIIVNELNSSDLPKEIKELFSIKNNSSNKANIKELLPNFISYLIENGYFFNENEIAAFISSIITKPFTILTGNSGSGKTKLAKLFAIWLNSESEYNPTRYRIVPVGADWTDNRNVIGFVNYLKTGKGNNEGKPIFQGTPVLDLILKAEKDPKNPYFLILDEMNLSHVERYFSDFLSAMESQENIPIHEEQDKLPTSSGFEVSSYISYPNNLYVIGTVNIDETTYMFSPKVLDRANVLEFSLDENDLENYLQQSNKEPITQNEKKQAPIGMPESFQKLSLQVRELNDESIQDLHGINNIKDSLIKFFIVLKKSRFEFAYRTVNEVLRYVRVAYAIKPDDNEWNWKHVMDMQILQKILPKLHGSRRRLEATLVALAHLCEQDSLEEAKQIFDNNAKIGEFDPNSRPKEDLYYPKSHHKLVAMINALRRDQFVSFIQ